MHKLCIWLTNCGQFAGVLFYNSYYSWSEQKQVIWKLLLYKKTTANEICQDTV